MIFHFYTYIPLTNFKAFSKLDLFIDIPFNSDIMSDWDSGWIESVSTLNSNTIESKAVGEVDDKLSQMGLTPDTRHAFRIIGEEVKVNIKSEEYFQNIKMFMRDQKLNELLS
jgi:hypothetical protein